MTIKPAVPKVQLRYGRSLLFGPSVRALVIDTLFEVGRSTEQATALWTAATTDTSPEGDRAFADRAGDGHPDNRQSGQTYELKAVSIPSIFSGPGADYREAILRSLPASSKLYVQCM